MRKPIFLVLAIAVGAAAITMQAQERIDQEMLWKIRAEAQRICHPENTRSSCSTKQ